MQPSSLHPAAVHRDVPPQRRYWHVQAIFGYQAVGTERAVPVATLA